MSVVKYRNVLYQFTKEIDWQNEREQITFICQGFLPDGFVDDITDVISLLTKLEEKNLLGIDRLYVLKELLKELEKWDLLRIVEQFEVKRKDYKQLLEQISRALDESNELQRLISICRRQNLIAREGGAHIVNINALLTELEQQNNLGIENLTILKTLATEVEKPDLCKLVEEFEKKRKHEDDAERERKEWEHCKRRTKAQAASVLAAGINIGERVRGVVTPHCTFRNLTGGAVVVTTWMVLRGSPSMEEFVKAFQGGVLPLGNFLRAISEGSIRFTVQANSISALEKLWQSYQDKTLQTKLQEFLVTEEIKQLAGGEVTLTVRIDEDEYRNALFDFIKSETEGLETRGEEKRGLKYRTSSDSDLLRMRGLVSENGKDVAQVKEFMSFQGKIRVEEFLENLPETESIIARTIDSGEGTWRSAPSECGSEEGAEESIQEKLNQVEEWITDAMEHLDRALSELGGTALTEAILRVSVNLVREELETCREKIHNFKSGKVIRGDEMVSVLCIAKESLLSPKLSTEGAIQIMKTYLQLDQDQLTHPTIEGKKNIRLMARAAKHSNRTDVFHYLRTITPPGTTGPLLPDDMPINYIPLRTLRHLTIRLSGEDEWKVIAEKLGLRPEEIRFLDISDRYRYPIQTLLSFVGGSRLTTVGTLYDCITETGLPAVADLL